MSDDQLKRIPPERIAQWEKLGVDAVEEDLKREHKGGRRLVQGPPGTGVQAHRWVKYKRAQERAEAEQRELELAAVVARHRERNEADAPKKREVFSLRPSIWGLGIDLKAAWSAARDWWLSRTRR
jgi:hypothetical protein